MRIQNIHKRGIKRKAIGILLLLVFTSFLISSCSMATSCGVKKGQANRMKRGWGGR